MTLSPHLKAQAARFGRVFTLTLLPLLVAFNGRYAAGAIVAAVVASCEVGVRAIWTVTPTK